MPPAAPRQRHVPLDRAAQEDERPHCRDHTLAVGPRPGVRVGSSRPASAFRFRVLAGRRRMAV